MKVVSTLHLLVILYSFACPPAWHPRVSRSRSRSRSCSLARSLARALSLMEKEIEAFLAPRGKAAVAHQIAEAFRTAAYPEEEWVEALIAMSPETLEELIAAVEAEAAAATQGKEPEPEPEPEPPSPNSLLLPFDTVAAQPPAVDLLGVLPPRVEGGGGEGYFSGSDAEGNGPIALPEPVFTLVCYPSELVGEKPRRVYVKALGGTLEGLKRSLQVRRTSSLPTQFTIPT
eukprot:COSAG03_NODE_208_length_10612_cov_35.757158_5_plen_230_part_00